LIRKPYLLRRITHASAAAIAATGVDYLSSGAITHSSVNLDVGLDIET
jgi:nicotinate-nucleotide pyrophosphorylase (carboxylating)